MTHTDQTTVNSTGATNQSGPVSVATPDGGFVVVWYDDADDNDSAQSVVRAQQFDAVGDKVGDEVQVGSSEVEGWDAFDMPPLTAEALSDGNVIIGWQADGSAGVEGNYSTAVVGSVFDTSSQTASPEFQMNTHEDSYQSAPSIVGLENGGFVSVWYDSASGNDDSNMLVRAQQFDNDGNKVGSEVQVGSSEVEGYDAFDMPPLTAVELSDGNVAIGWQADASAGVEGDYSTAVVGSIFDTDTQSASSEFQMNTHEDTYQSAPTMVGLPDGGFVSVWYDNAGGNDASNMVVRAQQFDNDGNKVGDEVQVGSSEVEGYDAFDMPPLTAEVLSDGNVAIGWQADGSARVEGYYSTATVGSIFDTSSQAAGPEFQMNPSDGTYESAPIIVNMGNGTFVATWYEDSASVDAGNVYAQQFYNDGTKIGEPMQVGTATVEGNDCFDMPPLSVIVADGGTVQISWQADQTESADSAAHTTSVVTSNFTPTVICFCPGTKIDTPNGRVAVEDLRVGDLVVTRDRGAQPIRWIGQRQLVRSKDQELSHLPIHMPAGALGKGVPDSDLKVSPQHRFVVRSKIVSRMYGCDEVLVAAKLLCGLAHVSVDTEIASFKYFHILLDRHEIIFANGAQAETLLLGDMALQSLSNVQRAEVMAVQTDLHLEPVLPIAHGRLAKQLIHRHAKNAKPVFSDQMPAYLSQAVHKTPEASAGRVWHASRVPLALSSYLARPNAA